MNYILFFTVLLLILIDYYLNADGILITPSIIVLISFALSSGLYAFNNYLFQKEISIKTYLVIVSALVFWIAGEWFGKHSYFRKRPSLENNFNKQIPVLIETKSFILVIFFIISAFVFIEKYIVMYKISILGGNSGDLIRAFGYARTYMSRYAEVTIDPGIFVTQLGVLSKCVTYYCVYAFFNNLFKCKKLTMGYVIVSIPYCFQLLCDTSRSSIMGAVIIIIVIAFIVDYSNHEWKSQHNKTIIKWGVISLIGIMALFTALAYLTSREGKDQWSTIVIYTSSPIYGLDYYLSGVKTPNEYFGQETLYYFYKATNMLKITDIPSYLWHHNFYSFNGLSSNIYTGLRRSIQDFGVMGMLFLRYILGVIYMYALRRIKRVTYNGTRGMFSAVFFAILYEPLFMMAIKDDFPSILSMSTVYLIFYMFFIIKFGIFRERTLIPKF